MYNGITEIPITGICDSGTSINLYGQQTNALTTATGNNVGIVFCAPEDAAVTKIGMSFYSFTGTAARELKLVICGLTSTGYYDTANILAQTNDYQYNDAAITYSTTGGLTYLDITKDGSGNSISSFNITKGTYYFVGVFRSNATGWSATNYITMSAPSQTAGGDYFFWSMSGPYSVNSSAAKQMSGNAVLLSSTTAYGKGFGSHGSQTISTGTTTNYGLRFNLPVDFGDNVTLCGINFAADIAGGTTANTISIKLYEDNGNGTATLLYTHTNNENYQEAGPIHISWLFDQAQTVLTNKNYIIAINNASATGDLTLHHYSFTDVKENTLFTAGYIPIRGVEVSSTGTITEIDKTYHINLLVENFVTNTGGGYTASFGGMLNG